MYHFLFLNAFDIETRFSKSDSGVCFVIPLLVPRCWYLLKPPLKRKNSTATWCKTERINCMKGGHEIDRWWLEWSEWPEIFPSIMILSGISDCWCQLMTIKTPWWKAMVVNCVSCRGIYRRRPDLQVANWGWTRENEMWNDMKQQITGWMWSIEVGISPKFLENIFC